MSAQLELSSLESDILSALWTRAYDPKGLPVKGFGNYHMVSDYNRASILQELETRCQALLDSGLIGWAEIFESTTVIKRWGDEGLLLKSYPPSPLTDKEIQKRRKR